MILDETSSSMVKKSIEATTLYLAHSSEYEPQKQGRSQDIVDIASITPKVTEDGVETFEIEVLKPMKGNEFLLRDKYYNREYWANEDFSVLLIDRQNGKVYIKFKEASAPLHVGINPNVEISFDLRILIINQKKVYEEHSFEISKPQFASKMETATGLQYVETFTHPNIPKLNQEQNQAVQTMLTEPLSFIKGPPGVGKTVTAAIPILSYMAAGQPVAIVTPTHVSLERSLSAINELCLSVGIDLNRVMRLGVSSQWYADAYPQTLESCDANEYLEQEQLDLLLLKIALEYRSIREQLKQRDELLTVEMLLSDLKTNIETLTQELPNEQRSSLHKMIEIKIKTIIESVTIPEIKTILGDMNYRNFEDRSQQFAQYKEAITTDDTDQHLSKAERDVLRINKLDHSSYGNRVELYEELVGSKYDYLSENEISERIIKTQMAIEKFKREYSKKKFQQAYLIGMTADSYNSRFKEDPLNVHHIFVDEGGYMSLIKILAMCRSNIPLSILGDYQQLPPVSEMNNEIKEGGEYEPVLLYDMSAFYLETLFEDGYEGLKRAYFNNQEPTFKTMPKVDLLHTHRFGNRLADILDQYVYKNGFSSAIGDGGFELCYLHAVNEVTPPGGRVNPAEMEAIRTLLEDGVAGSVAVLTPYKNQVAHLKKNLKGLIDPNQIMSIHKSQGQEWDTVIISVVDHQQKGAYGMWFTSSTNKMSKGLKVVNTAVSRAKKKLILVGHHGFWIAQPDQLLGELFRNADVMTSLQEVQVA